MDLETLISDERPALISRLGFMLGGDRDAAEDVAQETFARAWQRMPADLPRDAQRAWLRSASRNLAIDELRRRSRRPFTAIDDADPTALASEGIGEPDAAREAIAELPAHERFVLLLRFEAGFSHTEIAQLLDVTEEAARKRVSRARAAFMRRYRANRASPRATVLMVLRDERAEPYIEWLAPAGVDVRRLSKHPTERELLLADGMLFSGAMTDIDPALYGDELRISDEGMDLERDRIDLAVIKATLAFDLPYVGVCRGHQMLNIASGGTLYQDVVADGLTEITHDRGDHVVHTSESGSLRRLIGRKPLVASEHHQAVRRLGSNLTVSATSPDGVIETIERRDRSFAVGFQWHPERGEHNSGRLLAEAFADAITARAAA